jgi:NitT/TauT family transport system ATP-binding protein
MTTAPGPVVALDSVAKQFAGGSKVLDGITLAAEAGDFISLIGPSGCGKSTLLRIISGLSEPSSGRIARQLPPELARGGGLSFVFQDATLMPWLTVRKNVELPLRLQKAARADRERTAEELLLKVRLGEKAAAYPRQLSGGQKMRTSIARALVTRPSLLLLDEPFGALDEMTRDHLNEELLSLREAQGWTAFFVTHSVAEAVFLSNRVVVMAANPGRISTEFRIPFSFPRRAELRHSSEFHAMVIEVSRALRAVDTSKKADA